MNFVLILSLCGKGIEVVPVLEGLFYRNLTLPRYAAVILLQCGAQKPLEIVVLLPELSLLKTSPIYAHSFCP